MTRTKLTRAAALALVGVAGGLVALGAVALTTDLGGGTTTIVRTSAAPPIAAPVVADDRLSVSDIYAHAAPGVVQITSTTGVSENPTLAPFDQQASPQQRPADGSQHVSPQTSGSSQQLSPAHCLAGGSHGVKPHWVTRAAQTPPRQLAEQHSPSTAQA